MASGSGHEDPGFQRFWAIFPRKVAKGDARKAWQQTASIRPPLDKLIKAVIVAKASEQWRKDGGQYIPYPSTYLRQERWEDCHEIELGDVRGGKMWWETPSGVEEKGRELGMEWDALHGETFQAFAERVKARVRDSKIVPLQGAA